MKNLDESNRLQNTLGIVRAAKIISGDFPAGATRILKVNGLKRIKTAQSAFRSRALIHGLFGKSSMSSRKGSLKQKSERFDNNISKRGAVPKGKLKVICCRLERLTTVRI